jgi:hypothetical protein
MEVITQLTSTTVVAEDVSFNVDGLSSLKRRLESRGRCPIKG